MSEKLLGRKEKSLQAMLVAELELPASPMAASSEEQPGNPDDCGPRFPWVRRRESLLFPTVHFEPTAA